MMMPATTLMAFVAMIAGACASETPNWIGYRGDGSGIFRDVKPPTDVKAASERWQTTLPSWGHGSPICVAGKIYVVVETNLTCDFPQLLCYDLVTGKETWRAVLNPLEAAGVDAATKAKVEAQWHLLMNHINLGYQLKAASRVGGDVKTLKVEFQAKGLVIDETGEPASTRKAPTLVAASKMCSAHGVTLETWREHLGGRGVMCIGQAYATPVSDGQTIYASTAFGSFHAFTLDGKVLWRSSVPSKVDEYCINGHSPILYRNLLISDISGLARALDKTTGKLLWSHKLTEDGSIVSPDILTVGGKDILWAHGRAFLLPDGTPLKVEGWKDYGMQTLVKFDERDVAFFCGKGEHCGWTNKGHGPPLPPAAVRFKLEGTTLKAEVLWNGINDKPWGGNRPWMTYHGGRLYLPGQGYLDALSGKLLAGSMEEKGSKACPDTEHLLFIANDHIYTFDKGAGDKATNTPGGGLINVATLDGKPVSTRNVPFPKATPEEIPLIAAAGSYPEWRMFSYGFTFTFGPDCIIVRGLARLWCFGK